MHSLWSQKAQATDSDWVIDSHSVFTLYSQIFFSSDDIGTCFGLCSFKNCKQRIWAQVVYLGMIPGNLPERAGQWYRKGRSQQSPKKAFVSSSMWATEMKPHWGTRRTHWECCFCKWGSWGIYPPVPVLMVAWSPWAVLPACPWSSHVEGTLPGRERQESTRVGEPFADDVCGSLLS